MPLHKFAPCFLFHIFTHNWNIKHVGRYDKKKNLLRRVKLVWIQNCQTKAEEPCLLYYLPIARAERRYNKGTGVHAFPKNISVKWNAYSFVKDMNSNR